MSKCIKCGKEAPTWSVSMNVNARSVYGSAMCIDCLPENIRARVLAEQKRKEK